MRELLSNSSLFVFTADLQTVNYYTTNPLLELIYFLSLQ